jgi:DMSO/TMAO reductase YedYZ molybdopterin-dependent catalytic subunit
VDPATWQVRVHGKVPHEIRLSLDDLAALGTIEQTSVLDCTSGWAMEASWRGVPLRTILDAADWQGRGRSVVVRSITGWATALEPSDIDRALLATGVAGGPLPVANGAPCRLVVPDHRGLDWVKWVAEVEVV